MTDSPNLTGLQLAILRVLWDRGEAGVPEVFRALLDERGLAQSTIATMVARMEKRGILTRRWEDRQYLYRPAYTEEEVRRSMVADLTSLLFGGSSAALVSHLVESREMAPGDLDAVRALLDSMDEAEDDDPR